MQVLRSREPNGVAVAYLTDAAADLMQGRKALTAGTAHLGWLQETAPLSP